MERVGIVTLQGKYNYGNRLQNYATTSIFEKMGFEVESLLLTRKPCLREKARRGVKRMLRRAADAPESLMSSERLKSFESFNSLMKFREVSQPNDLSVRDYSFFAVGSDQVWNPYHFRYNEDWYFLKFCEADKRVALSPSIGLDELTPRQARHLSRGVKGFNVLSIREKRGAELLQSCGYDAPIICDPTLVLSRNSWSSVANDRLTPTDPYVFTYLLGGVGTEAKMILDVLVNKRNLSIVSLADREGPGDLPAGPAEFISLISNASHIVTDSFHAAVFASIFEIPLTIVRREGGAKMFSRLESLSETLGIQKKIYGFRDYSLTHAEDYEGVAHAISREREEFMGYLNKCLGMGGEE